MDHSHKDNNIKYIQPAIYFHILVGNCTLYHQSPQGHWQIDRKMKQQRYLPLLM